MSEAEIVYNSFVQMIKRNTVTSVIVGTVSAIDHNQFTCDITPADGGAIFHDIRLKASIDTNEQGLIIIPSNGASVIMIRIGTDEHSAYVLTASSVDRYFIKTATGITLEISTSGELKLNGDSFKGVLKHDDVKSALDTLQLSVNAIKAGCVAGFQALSAIDGGASVLAFNTATGSMQPINTNNLQNPKVKHG